MHPMNATHGSSIVRTLIRTASLSLALAAAGCTAAGNAESRANEADERLRYGKYDEAIADLEMALQKEPRHFGAWIGLAMIFESIDRPRAALMACRKALAVHPFLAAAKQCEKRMIPKVDGRSL